MRPCIFQPRNFTGWGSEGVNNYKHTTPAATTTTCNHRFHCYHYTIIVSYNPDNTKQRAYIAYIFSEELPLTGDKRTGSYMKQTEIISVRVILLNLADIVCDLVLQITNAFFSTFLPRHALLCLKNRIQAHKTVQNNAIY